MKKLLLLYLIIVTFSCSKHDDNLTNVQSNYRTTKEILSFDNFDDFTKTYNELSKFETEDQFENWIFEKKHNSLLERLEEEANDLTLDETPLNDEYDGYSTMLKAMFNSNSEIKIGDDIVVLKNGNLLISQNTNDNELSVLGRIEISNDDTNKDSNDESRVFQSNKWVKKTKTFHAYNGRDCANGLKGSSRNRMFVHEMRNEKIYSGENLVSDKLILRIRMNGRYCSFWKCSWNNVTAESRYIDVDIVGYRLLGPGPNAFFSYNNTFNCVSNHVSITLVDHLGSYLGISQDVTFSGTITHTHFSNSASFFNTDPSNYSWVQNASEFN